MRQCAGRAVVRRPLQMGFGQRLGLAQALIHSPTILILDEPTSSLSATEIDRLFDNIRQLKSKGEGRYVGVATGMNSLIRPALYGAYHEITNLTRADDPATELVNVVGPICESADVLGHDRASRRAQIRYGVAEIAESA